MRFTIRLENDNYLDLEFRLDTETLYIAFHGGALIRLLFPQPYAVVFTELLHRQISFPCYLVICRARHHVSWNQARQNRFDLEVRIRADRLIHNVLCTIVFVIHRSSPQSIFIPQNGQYASLSTTVPEE